MDESRLHLVSNANACITLTMTARCMLLTKLKSGGFQDASQCMQAFVDLKKGASPELGSDLSRLKVSVDTSIPDILHIKITDAEKERWEVPVDLLPRGTADLTGTNHQ